MGFKCFMTFNLKLLLNRAKICSIRKPYFTGACCAYCFFLVLYNLGRMCHSCKAFSKKMHFDCMLLVLARKRNKQKNLNILFSLNFLQCNAAKWVLLRSPTQLLFYGREEAYKHQARRPRRRGFSPKSHLKTLKT